MSNLEVVGRSTIYWLSARAESGSDRASECRGSSSRFHHPWLQYRTEGKIPTIFLWVDTNRFLKPNGRDILVTSENVTEYVAEVLDAILGKGAAIQAKAFRDGFSKVFPIADLRAFSADELVMLFGNSEEDWSVESEYIDPLVDSYPYITISTL